MGAKIGVIFSKGISAHGDGRNEVFQNHSSDGFLVKQFYRIL